MTRSSTASPMVLYSAVHMFTRPLCRPFDGKPNTTRLGHREPVMGSNAILYFEKGCSFSCTFVPDQFSGGSYHWVRRNVQKLPCWTHDRESVPIEVKFLEGSISPSGLLQKAVCTENQSNSTFHRSVIRNFHDF